MPLSTAWGISSADTGDGHLRLVYDLRYGYNIDFSGIQQPLHPNP